MPDLGKYAFAVLGSWGLTFVLIGVLVAVTLLQRAWVKRALAEAEARAALAQEAR